MDDATEESGKADNFDELCKVCSFLPPFSQGFPPSTKAKMTKDLHTSSDCVIKYK